MKYINNKIIEEVVVSGLKFIGYHVKVNYQTVFTGKIFTSTPKNNSEYTFSVYLNDILNSFYEKTIIPRHTSDVETYYNNDIILHYEVIFFKLEDNEIFESISDDVYMWYFGLSEQPFSLNKLVIPVENELPHKISRNNNLFNYSNISYIAKNKYPQITTGNIHARVENNIDNSVANIQDIIANRNISHSYEFKGSITMYFLNPELTKGDLFNYNYKPNQQYGILMQLSDIAEGSVGFKLQYFYTDGTNEIVSITGVSGESPMYTTISRPGKTLKTIKFITGTLDYTNVERFDLKEVDYNSDNLVFNGSGVGMVGWDLIGTIKWEQNYPYRWFECNNTSSNSGSAMSQRIKVPSGGKYYLKFYSQLSLLNNANSVRIAIRMYDEDGEMMVDKTEYIGNSNSFESRTITIDAPSNIRLITIYFILNSNSSAKLAHIRLSKNPNETEIFSVKDAVYGLNKYPLLKGVNLLDTETIASGAGYSGSTPVVKYIKNGINISGEKGSTSVVYLLDFRDNNFEYANRLCGEPVVLSYNIKNNLNTRMQMQIGIWNDFAAQRDTYIVMNPNESRKVIIKGTVRSLWDFWQWQFSTLYSESTVTNIDVDITDVKFELGTTQTKFTPTEIDSDKLVIDNINIGEFNYLDINYKKISELYQDADRQDKINIYLEPNGVGGLLYAGKVDIKDCSNKYTIHWTARNGSTQMLEMNGKSLPGATYDRKTIHDQYDELNTYRVDSEFTWDLNSYYLNDSEYAALESLMCAKDIILNDLVNNRQYNVIIVDTDYTERTYKNTKALLSFNIKLKNNKKQVI